MEDSPTAATDVVVYQRPGCPYCVSLTLGLRARRIPFRSVNVWEDSKASAFVRQQSNGNETVPVVTVGAHVLVNPGARRVADLATRAS